MMAKYKSHVDAIKYLRNGYLDRELSYREIAEVLSQYCGETVPKSEPWNAEHRKYRCPRRVKTALINMGLLDSGRRYRFFYEVSEEKYKVLQAWLDRHEYESFTDYMRGEEGWLPWE